LGDIPTLSASWNSVYSNVNSNSARYTTIDYLSTNNIIINSVNVITSLSSTSLASNTLSSRSITLIHSPENDGTNPNIQIGEISTTTGFSGFNIFYDEFQNKLTITSLFSGVSSAVVTIDRNGVASGPMFPYTVTLTPFATAAGNANSFYPASLSGVIPYNEIVSRMRLGKGRLSGLLMYGLSATSATKNQVARMQFSSGANFINPVDIVFSSVGAANTMYLRRLDAFMLNASTLVFADPAEQSPYGTTARSYACYTLSSADIGTPDLYFRVGFNPILNLGCALSGGYISIEP
jgi:hypothetical protein